VLVVDPRVVPLLRHRVVLLVIIVRPGVVIIVCGRREGDVRRSRGNVLEVLPDTVVSFVGGRQSRENLYRHGDCQTKRTWDGPWKI